MTLRSPAYLPSPFERRLLAAVKFAAFLVAAGTGAMILGWLLSLVVGYNLLMLAGGICAAIGALAFLTMGAAMLLPLKVR